MVGTMLLVPRCYYSIPLKEKLIIYCILDSDYHSKIEIKEKYEEAKLKGIDLHIWQKKEIENYFIIPEAIQRIIIKRSNGEFSPSVDRIKRQLLIISTSVKNDITDCIANEIFQKNKVLGLQNANREARKYVDEVEASKGDILSIISGKDIISKMSKWAQNKYKVSFSPVALLKEITRAEIDGEVLSIINSLETNSQFSVAS